MKVDGPYLNLIKESIEQIFVYLGEKEKERFLNDDLIKDACLTRLMIIGEYAGKVSQPTKERFPEVEWRSMKVARNFYIHTYDKINWERVWDTITIDLLLLKPKIEAIISIVEKEEE